MTQPTLVCMSWRGGDRLRRCLASIAATIDYFDRVIVSVTATDDSDDARQARAFAQEHPKVEVLCTGRELPTMQHQAYWIDYLQATGSKRSDWIYWLAYDDEVRLTGLEAITDSKKHWPLMPGTAYFGPWAMRHEAADHLWDGDPEADLESWTSFPISGPTRLTVAQWIADQLRQPTYMQMSGSVTQFAGFVDLRDLRPKKKGPMRIEMAVAAARGNTHVEEFSQPVSIIYGRSNSDRASYGKAARSEDLHLISWLARYCAAHPDQAWPTTTAVMSASATSLRAAIGRGSTPAEEWRSRGLVRP